MHRPARADLSRARRANGQTPGQWHVEGLSVAETERGFAQAYRPVWGGKVARPGGRSRGNIAETESMGISRLPPFTRRRSSPPVRAAHREKQALCRRSLRGRKSDRQSTKHAQQNQANHPMFFFVEVYSYQYRLLLCTFLVPGTESRARPQVLPTTYEPEARHVRLLPILEGIQLSIDADAAAVPGARWEKRHWEGRTPALQGGGGG
eukprot:gene17266-biopygen11374